MNLALSVDSKSADLTVEGEVFAAPVKKADHPRVSHVIASSGMSSRFVLPVGKYEYKYHVSAGVGPLTVAIVCVDDGRVIAKDDEDTKYGFSGKVLSFEVP
jgi:hypothetical protein